MRTEASSGCRRRSATKSVRPSPLNIKNKKKIKKSLRPLGDVGAEQSDNFACDIHIKRTFKDIEVYPEEETR